MVEVDLPSTIMADDVNAVVGVLLMFQKAWSVLLCAGADAAVVMSV